MINFGVSRSFQKPHGGIEDPPGDACCRTQFMGFLYKLLGGCMCPARRRELVWPVSHGFMIFCDVYDA